MSAEDDRAERHGAVSKGIFAGIYGARTWRLAGICGGSAVYSGCLPDMLANNAGRKPELTAVLADSPFIRCKKSMANAAVVNVMP